MVLTLSTEEQSVTVVGGEPSGIEFGKADRVGIERGEESAQMCRGIVDGDTVKKDKIFIRTPAADMQLVRQIVHCDDTWHQLQCLYKIAFKQSGHRGDLSWREHDMADFDRLFEPGSFCGNRYLFNFYCRRVQFDIEGEILILFNGDIS